MLVASYCVYIFMLDCSWDGMAHSHSIECSGSSNGHRRGRCVEHMGAAFVCIALDSDSSCWPQGPRRDEGATGRESAMAKFAR